jgi:hypothetical protein
MQLSLIAATIFDHPGFLLLIVFVALVRWLASKAKQTQNQQPPPTPSPAPPSRPIPRGGDTQADEDRIRKFLEALGQPPGTTPPKVVTQRRQTRPDLVSPLPPLKTKPPPLPQVASPPRPPPFETARMLPMAARETAFEVRDVARQTSIEPAPQTRTIPAARLSSRVGLGTPQDLRNAIVLREIFGPPRSLQPFDPNNAA